MLSGSEESNLVRAAAAGDGPAFANLYESYERRIFNYLLRLLGDRHEAEDATQEAFIKVMAKLPDLDHDNLEFGAYLYTAARNAGYDVIAKRKRLEPTGAVPEQAEAPFRGELSDLETDPERSALASSQEAAVQTANERLPERQREVLALRELDGMSYDEIADVMEMKSNAVAQLISRARIALRKEMRAGAAASVAFTTADCERAHGELACRQDGQAKGFDSQWLDSHLALCDNCQVAGEEMAEAGVSYRAWAPIVPAAWLFREVMAKASEISGNDWSGVERTEPDPATEGAGKMVGRDAPDSDSSATATGGGRGKTVALVGAASMVVAAIFASLLLAEANAPERVAGVSELVIRPASKESPDDDGGKVAGKVKPKRTARKSQEIVSTVDPALPVDSADAATPEGEDSGASNNSGSGKPGNLGDFAGGGGGSNGGSGNGSSNPAPTGEPADPVEPANPVTPNPEPADPVEPTPPADPEPEPTPIPGGPGNIAIPGGPTPG